MRLEVTAPKVSAQRTAISPDVVFIIVCIASCTSFIWLAKLRGLYSARNEWHSPSQAPGDFSRSSLSCQWQDTIIVVGPKFTIKRSITPCLLGSRGQGVFACNKFPSAALRARFNDEWKDLVFDRYQMVMAPGRGSNGSFWVSV